jgi:hypothetical protein
MRYTRKRNNHGYRRVEKGGKRCRPLPVLNLVYRQGQAATALNLQGVYVPFWVFDGFVDVRA